MNLHWYIRFDPLSTRGQKIIEEWKLKMMKMMNNYLQENYYVRDLYTKEIQNSKIFIQKGFYLMNLRAKKRTKTARNFIRKKDGYEKYCKL